MKRIFLGSLLAITASGVAWAAEEGAAAEQPNGPEITKYGDWGQACEMVPGVETELCYIFQRLRVKETENIVMNTTVAINPKDGKPVISVTLPLGIFLPPGVQLIVDKNEQGLRAPFIMCAPGGCRASAPLDEENLKRMQGGDQMLVAFIDGTRKTVRIPVSLKGFTKGFGSLK